MNDPRKNAVLLSRLQALAATYLKLLCEPPTR